MSLGGSDGWCEATPQGVWPPGSARFCTALQNPPVQDLRSRRSRNRCSTDITSALPPELHRHPQLGAPCPGVFLRSDLRKFLRCLRKSRGHYVPVHGRVLAQGLDGGAQEAKGVDGGLFAAPRAKVKLQPATPGPQVVETRGDLKSWTPLSTKAPGLVEVTVDTSAEGRFYRLVPLKYVQGTRLETPSAPRATRRRGPRPGRRCRPGSRTPRRPAAGLCGPRHPDRGWPW